MTSRLLHPTLAALVALGALAVTASPVKADADSTSLPRLILAARAGALAAAARWEASGRLAPPRIPALDHAAPLGVHAWIPQRGSSSCAALCGVITALGGDGREGAPRARKLAERLSGGYQLSPSHRLSVRPRLQRMHGKRMAGFSVRISGF